jgi:hypothetical protein
MFKFNSDEDFKQYWLHHCHSPSPHDTIHKIIDLKWNPLSQVGGFDVHCWVDDKRFIDRDIRDENVFVWRRLGWKRKDMICIRKPYPAKWQPVLHDYFQEVYTQIPKHANNRVFTCLTKAFAFEKKHGGRVIFGAFGIMCNGTIHFEYG